VVARLAPPPPAVPFDRRQPALAAQPGQPLAPEKLDQMRKPGEEYNRPTVKYTPPARSSNPPPKNHPAPKPSKPPKPGKPH
ncbi:MAG: hypothetical protein WBD54_04230, partial [Candidatus Acidiferrales bacterium]